MGGARILTSSLLVAGLVATGPTSSMAATSSPVDLFVASLDQAATAGQACTFVLGSVATKPAFSTGFYDLEVTLTRRAAQGAQAERALGPPEVLASVSSVDAVDGAALVFGKKVCGPASGSTTLEVQVAAHTLRGDSRTVLAG